jgi:hypothetical protein
MVRKAFQWVIVAAALAAPLLLGACIDDHMAEECQYLGTCPDDAGNDAGDASQDVTDGGGK